VNIYFGIQWFAIQSGNLCYLETGLTQEGDSLEYLMRCIPD